MSWFKKIFGSQSSSQGSSQSSSQEARVYYTCNISTKEKNETDNNEKESENITVSELEECYDATQSTQGSSCYSWSGVNQGFDIRGEKRELSDNKEEPWWESFKSQSTQKSTQESSQMKLFSSQSSLQASSSQVGASSLQDDDKSDKEEKDEDEKISLFKAGKVQEIQIYVNSYFSVLVKY